MYDLSILIPARHEQFLARTVQDILEHKEGRTQVIIFLDGEWSDPGIPDHPDVVIIHSSVSIGQRAATNQAARVSTAKYLMKCDAHVSFSQGFDVQMMADMQDNWTMVPIMRNLHAFDWVCEKGHRRYQGPSGACLECGLPTVQDVVWIAKNSPQSKSYRFDREMHFQYFGEFSKRPEGQGDLTPTMGLQGSCFMMTREKYWELDICDEEHGSWGQQGVEVACKTWLSGGEVRVNHKAYYAHMFRTQGGDFGFPYPISGRQVEHARKYSKALWLGNSWPKAIHDLQWLIDKFAPVPGWDDTGKPVTSNKGIIYYTDNQLNVKLAQKVQKQIRSIGLPIASVSLKTMNNMGTNAYMPALSRGPLTMFKQILAALRLSDAEIVFFCEHDVLYHPSHFDFIPPQRDKFYYNLNWWKVREDGFAVRWDAKQVSQLCCYREHAIEYYKERIADIEANGFNRSYEPGGRDPNLYGTWSSEFPNIDVRHPGTLTKSKWSPDDFRDKSTGENWAESTTANIPGWPDLTAILS